MAIKLDDLKQKVAAFHKQASATMPVDPTEKGKAMAPIDPIEDPKLPEVSNTPGAKVDPNIETKPSMSDANAKTPKDGNAEDAQTKMPKDNTQTKMANDRLSVSIAKLKEITKNAGKKELPAFIKEKIEERKMKEEKKMAKGEKMSKGEKVEKNATQNDSDASFTMGPEALSKLASAIFETQEGIDAVLPVLKKKAGQDAAIELLKEASAEYERQVEEFAFMQKYAAAIEAEQEYMDAVAGEIIKSASSPEEAELLVKAAANHVKNIDLLETPLEKAAYDQAVSDAAEMVGSMEEGGAPALQGADGSPTIEQILMLLEQAVAAGEISEEDAIAVAESLMSDDGESEMDEEEGPMEEEDMPKEASAKTNTILEVLKTR
jgi:hypothetical protein